MKSGTNLTEEIEFLILLVSDLFKISVEDKKKQKHLHQLKSQYDNAKKYSRKI